MSRELTVSLLAFQKLPGQFALTLRQPELLFTEARAVILLASGKYKGAEYRAMTGAELEALMLAARFFVRTAFLAHGADHYSLFGLQAGAESTEIKDRYRLMMRLTHPDHSSANEMIWPADTVQRLNRAYEILSTPAARRSYDQMLVLSDAGAYRPNKLPRSNANQPVDSVKRIQPQVRKLLIPMSVVAAVLGAIPMVLIWSHPHVSTKGALVQKPQIKAVPADHMVSHSPVSSAALSGSGAVSPDRTKRELQNSAAAVGEADEVRAAIGAGNVASVPKSFATSVPQRERTAPSDAMSLKPAVMMTGVAQVDGDSPSISAALASASPSRTTRSGDVLMATPQKRQAALKEIEPIQLNREEDMAGVKITANKTNSLKVTEDSLLILSRPTLRAVEPVLVKMLEKLESGRAELLLPLMDGTAQSMPKVQEFLIYLNSILESTPSRRVEHMVFSVDPDGSVGERLRVKGHVRLLLTGLSGAEMRKNLAMRVDFVNRHGQPLAVAMDGREVDQ